MNVVSSGINFHSSSAANHMVSHDVNAVCYKHFNSERGISQCKCGTVISSLAGNMVSHGINVVQLFP